MPRRQRRDIDPTERIPMHHAETIGGDSEAAVIEKPEGDFVIQTRDEEIPLDPDPEVHVHIDVDLPGLVGQIAEIMGRKPWQIEKAPGGGISSEEQSLRVFQKPPDPPHGALDPKTGVPMGGRVQADNPALYVMRTGNDTLGKHDTPKSKHRDHGPKGRGKQKEKSDSPKKAVLKGDVTEAEDKLKQVAERVVDAVEQAGFNTVPARWVSYRLFDPGTFYGMPGGAAGEEDDGSGWVVAIQRSDEYDEDEDFEGTVLHEYAHILAMSGLRDGDYGQIDFRNFIYEGKPKWKELGYPRDMIHHWGEAREAMAEGIKLLISDPERFLEVDPKFYGVMVKELRKPQNDIFQESNGPKLRKHDTPKSPHKEHGLKGRGKQEKSNLRQTGKRADTGSARPVKNRLSKREMGKLGERLAIDYLKGLGHDDARLINVSQENFAVDGVADSAVFEVKAGTVSNGLSARHWRATLGQPGKRETEYLKQASPEEKREWNAQKHQAVIERKERALQEISRDMGHEVSGKTISFIVDPDRQAADIYVFDGFHRRIGWDGDQARDGYVGSYRYG